MSSNRDALGVASPLKDLGREPVGLGGSAPAPAPDSVELAAEEVSLELANVPGQFVPRPRVFLSQHQQSRPGHLATRRQ